ncbi:MAG TPA: hypothetical protein VGK25_14170 [Ignavibacteria bacterium]
MRCIKWDDKFFKIRGLSIWVYNKSNIVSSNDKLYKQDLVKLYSNRKNKTNNRKTNR